MKDVSIIIPIYNCDKYLEDCLDSVVKQTYPAKKIEVILINDASTDKSSQICEKYCKKNDWIFINRKENKGVSFSRNEGIKKSKGKYIIFLDSDDMLYDYAVEKLINNIKKNDSDVVVSKLNSFNSSGTYGYYSDKYLKTEKVFKINNNKKILNFISVCGKIYKRSLINDNLFLEGVKHEDNYFSLMVYYNSKKIATLPEFTYYRRIREDEDKSIMQNLNFDTYGDLLKNFYAFSKHIEFSKNYLFYFNFMIRKTINYIMMNVEKKDIKKAYLKHKGYMLFLKEEKKANKVIYLFIKIKFSIYTILAWFYRVLKK